MCTKFSKLGLTAALVLVLSLLVPASVWATAYTWTGTTSNVWNLDTNWGQTSGSGLYPGSAVAYADTATIGTVITNTPVSLSTLATLGGGATVLTLSNVAGSATGLDIAGTGILGVQGNIVLSSGTTNGRKITIEGTLRNDAASSATTYTISGGTNAGDLIQLIGGTISSPNGGKWTFSRPVQGYGTISSVFTGTVLANVAGQTLHITNPAESISGSSLTNTGGILSLEGIAVSGGTLSVTGSGLTILTGGTLTGTITATAGEVDINGTTLNSVSNMSGTVKLTGNSAANTVSITNLLFNGNKLDVTGTVTNFGSIHVDAGVLNNASTSATTAVSNGSQLYLAGGSITNTGGSAYTFATNVQGYGSVSGITGFTGPGFTANGGTVATPQTMTWNGGGVTLGTHSGSGATLSAAANTTLDLKGTFNVINPGIISPSTGTIALDGATINTYDPTGGVGGTPITWNETVMAGAISVPNDSTLIGNFSSAATLTINPSIQLSMSGATVNLTAGSMTNSGTLNIGTGTLNNSTASSYSLLGSGLATLAGGSITSTGSGGFISSLTVQGYGNVSAPFTNSGKVIADGGRNRTNNGILRRYQRHHKHGRHRLVRSEQGHVDPAQPANLRTR